MFFNLNFPHSYIPNSLKSLYFLKFPYLVHFMQHTTIGCVIENTQKKLKNKLKFFKKHPIRLIEAINNN